MKTTNTNSKVVFNHFYKLRHDLKRTILYSPEDSVENLCVEVNKSWLSIIHPVYAMILSFISEPIILSELIIKIAFFLDISEKKAYKIINSLIGQEEPFFIDYNGHNSYFPVNLIIDASEPYSHIVNYSPQYFVYDEIDMLQQRFYKAPLNAVFMVNNRCITDCIYCYADKSIKTNELSLDEIEKIFADAKSVGIASLMPTGGEFFLHSEWEKLIELFAKYGYNLGLISTKIPIVETQVQLVKLHGIKIQISLDAIEDDTLSTILKVKTGYAEKIKNTIRLLDKYEIPFQVSTVLTIHNANIANLEKIYEFLINLRNIQRWEIRLAFRSLYSRGNFNNIKVQKEDINIINQWIISLQEKATINIQWDVSSIGRYFQSKEGSKSFIGARCSANYSNILILPDGKVTLCEQLYWHSRYIIGDLKKNSIEEVWNSQKALQLAFPQKKDFREQSVCKHCDIFEECYNYPNKCIVDVLKGYGDENYDYPDPRCIKAPDFTNELMY